MVDAVKVIPSAHGWLLEKISLQLLNFNFGPCRQIPSLICNRPNHNKLQNFPLKIIIRLTPTQNHNNVWNMVQYSWWSKPQCFITPDSPAKFGQKIILSSTKTSGLNRMAHLGEAWGNPYSPTHGTGEAGRGSHFLFTYTVRCSVMFQRVILQL